MAGFAYRPRARADLVEQFLYLAGEAGVELAERYFAAVERTCGRLARHPYSGTVYDSGIGGMAGMRRAPVSGFSNYLVFYLPRERAGGAEVIRVLHGARDLEALFGEG